MYWKKYNSNLEKLSKVLLKHNKNHTFNHVEDSFYNHVRDIVAIEIVNKIETKKNETFVLDYGSNFVPWSNITNKINTKKLNVTVYDQFSKQAEDNIKIKNEFSCKKFSSLNEISKMSFDITIFGSVIQYIDDFYELIKKSDFLKAPKLIFTHTPLSLKREFDSMQFSDFKGHQKIYSFVELNNFLKKFGYECTFKSTLDPKLAQSEDKFLDNLVYANLIFKQK